MRGRMGICARCNRDRPIAARGLDRTCYNTEYEAGRIEQWPLADRKEKAPPRPTPDERSALVGQSAPTGIVCDWCGAALTRTRNTGDEPLYEVYTVAGALVAVCFEACPAGRVLELTEVRSDG